MQKLSAMRYIINHKARIMVLVVTIALSVYIMTVVSYTLIVNEMMIRDAFMDMSDKIQQVEISPDYFDNKTDNSHFEKWEHLRANKQNYEKLAEKIQNDSEVEDAFLSSYVHIFMTSELNDIDFYIPLVSPDEVSILADRFDTKILNGKMPENPGEVVVSKKILLNQKKKTGDLLDDHNSQYKIVGEVDFDGYLAFGCKYDDSKFYEILIISDIKDITSLLERNGITDQRYVTNKADHETQNIFLEENVHKINDISNIVNCVIIAVTCIILAIVYLQYLRDRYNEWCLYYSLGFSLHDIYMAANRELLFTFGMGIFLAGMIFFPDLLLNSELEKEYYKEHNNTMQTISVLVLLFGLFQIALRYQLCKIKTADISEEELY